MDAVLIIGDVRCCRGRMVRYLLADDPGSRGLLGSQVMVAEFTQEELAKERVEGLLQAFFYRPADIVLSLERGEVQFQYQEHTFFW